MANVVIDLLGVIVLEVAKVVGRQVPIGYVVSGLSAETPQQAYISDALWCVGHRRADSKRSERKEEAPRTCDGVRHLPHRITCEDPRNTITLDHTRAYSR